MEVFWSRLVILVHIIMVNSLLFLAWQWLSSSTLSPYCWALSNASWRRAIPKFPFVTNVHVLVQMLLMVKVSAEDLPWLHMRSQAEPHAHTHKLNTMNIKNIAMSLCQAPPLQEALELVTVQGVRLNGEDVLWILFFYFRNNGFFSWEQRGKAN